MEVLGYNFGTKEEEDIVTSLLESFKLIYVDYYIAKLVVQLRKKYTIKQFDCQIIPTP